MLYEALAAALVALAVIAALVSPLSRPGEAAPVGADEAEDAEDTPRGIALAALREIEFDRATGKLSDEDYADLRARYTAEALTVLRQEDGSVVRRLGGSASERLSGTEGGPPAASSAHAPAAEPPSRRAAESTEPDPLEAMIADRVRRLDGAIINCPACGPRPETDALFCSSCGRSLTVGGCPSCGTPLVPGSRYCDSCGAAVAGTAATRGR